jgi:hypothetical protein
MRQQGRALLITVSSTERIDMKEVIIDSDGTFKYILLLLSKPKEDKFMYCV